MLSDTTFDELFLLEPDTVKPFVQKNEWAIHDVLPILSKRYGKLDVTIVTFSISEDSLRTLFLQAEAGNIGTLTMLLDFSVRKNKLEMLLFAHGFSSEIFMNDVHAKIFLVSNDNFRFGIVGSANLNVNRRIESGFYFTGTDFFDFFKNEVDGYIQQSVKYEPEYGTTG